MNTPSEETRVIIATLDQIEELAPLFDAYRQFYKQPSDPAGARRFLEERFRLRESVVFLAYRQGRAVGFTQLYPSFSSISMLRQWLLNDLYVLPEMRGQRIGEALIARAAAFSREMGAKGLQLSTAVDNHTAV